METLPLHLRISWLVAIVLFSLVGMWVLDEFVINVAQEVEYLQDDG